MKTKTIARFGIVTYIALLSVAHLPRSSHAQGTTCPANTNPVGLAGGSGLLWSCYYRATGAGSYWHKGFTEGNYTVSVYVRSFDITNAGICPGSDRNTGTVQGFRNVSAQTSAFSTVQCSGASFHSYEGRGTHNHNGSVGYTSLNR